jgi:dGTPase
MKQWTPADRCKRRTSVSKEDQRRPFERDRDRILYSSAFHRLAGVTQIVRAGEEDVFHTRQQHTYKVAQVGRRLAQNCRRRKPELALALGVHEEVVEAACLAHDLGHPPFGHVGEKVLDELLTEKEDPDGFEGNAQSFRIITKLSVRFAQANGLDLTRATLAACLKYPWMRDRRDKKKEKKWSVYRSEEEEFLFAWEQQPGDLRTAEAHLMDWADDIAYSVHDLEDFHRCGVIPWQMLLNSSGHQQRLLDNALKDWFDPPDDARQRLKRALENLLQLFPLYGVVNATYNGTRDQRQELRTLTSMLIGRYVNAAELVEEGTGIYISGEEETEVRVLKQITRDYIIDNPSLAAQQHGHKKIIEFLFKSIHGAIDPRMPEIPAFVPKRLHYIWTLDKMTHARFAADCVASLTDREAQSLFSRLSGASSGSVLDPIVR